MHMNMCVKCMQICVLNEYEYVCKMHTNMRLKMHMNICVKYISICVLNDYEYEYVSYMNMNMNMCLK